MLSLQTLFYEDLSLGQTESLTKIVSASDVVGFAEVSGDRNPIHLSEHFAARTRAIFPLFFGAAWPMSDAW